ncbi:MAG: dihydrodipicolinate synthase family protein [Alphaproteobacteria bacterium]|nr:dihydrodipicolinate synthase family protein [Alphaproteobacteria bacterium]
MNKATNLPITGVYCAATTPVDANGKVRLDLFAEHCKLLLQEGAHGIALLGTTGEANNYSGAERRALLEAAIESGVNGNQLLPGTSACSVPETVELTRHAVENGARACVLLPPFYYKGVSDEGIYRFYANVINQVNDARLKVILYHIPQVTQISLSHDLIRRLIKEFPNTIIGIKDSAGDIKHMESLVNTFDNFSVFAGADPLLKPILEAGGAGCITATSNLRSDALRTVFDNWSDPNAKDIVENAQEHINAWRELTNSYVQLPTVKAMVAHSRGNLDWLNARPPLVSLTEAECKIIWKKMDELSA